MTGQVSEPDTLLMGEAPTAAHRRAAAALMILMLAGFAAVAPIAGKPLFELNAFFPTLDAIVFVTDLVTAVLLLAQYSIHRSRALFALACGYLFTAFIVVPHALTFRGAFSPTGLLGSGIQTGSWLFIFWHLGFAVALLAYALLRRRQATSAPRKESVARPIAAAVAALLLLVSGLTWLSTSGADLLPHIVTDQRSLSPIVVYPVGLTILVTAAAAAVLSIGQRSKLDLWLQVVALAFILEMIFSGLLPTIRFSTGFYAGRVFSLITSSIVLVILLAEMTRLYAEVARANAVLRREQDNKFLNLEAMSASIAHEVRQPLSAIAATGGAALRFLKRDAPDAVGLEKALVHMMDASRRASEIFDNVRVLFGRAEMPRTQVDVNSLILDALRVLDADLRREAIRTTVMLSPDLALLTAHKGQLQEVVFNLMNNAIEAMQAVQGSRTLRITTDADSEGSIEICIEDTGPGISLDRPEAIFDAFVTTKPSGMGLGLAICRMIVDRHGGTLKAGRSKLGGALFRIRFPAEASEMAPARSSAA